MLHYINSNDILFLEGFDMDRFIACVECNTIYLKEMDKCPACRAIYAEFLAKVAKQRAEKVMGDRELLRKTIFNKGNML